MSVATPDIAAPRARIDSLDIIRGVVMVLMAVDHVRVYPGFVYVVFAMVVAILYVPCRWFARVKARQYTGWLRYL